jgi:hypothetical protein
VRFALVLFDLGLEFLRFLRELRGERLELFELKTSALAMKEFRDLLFPVFEFLDEEVVAFGDFGDFAVGAGLEIDVILPGFVDFAGKSVLLPDHFVEMAHADLCHDGLFLAALEDGGHARVAAGFVADVVDDVHNGILVPPFGVLNALNFSAHNL